MKPEFGQRIICRYDGDGYFYPGTIRTNQDGQTIVIFDMDIEQEAIGHTLLSMNNSNSLLSLHIHDCVLVRQMRETEEYWVPGLVLCRLPPCCSPDHLYKIEVYDRFPRQVGL